MQSITRERRTPAHARHEAADRPPLGATIIEGDGVIVDAGTNKVVAVQAIVARDVANTAAQMLHQIHWGAERGRSDSDNEARLSGIMASSATFGFTFPNPLRRRYACTPSGFNRMHPGIMAELETAAGIADAAFQMYAPDVYVETTTAVRERIPECWRLGPSPWTSGILNNNTSLPYHKDSGNISRSWSAMLSIRAHCDGGFLHLADYDVWLGVPNGSISIFDGQSVLHGVSPFHLTKPSGHRYTAVLYSPSRMSKCAPSFDQEVLYAQRRATEAEEKRRR